MKRILHIVGHLRKNGTENFIMNLFRVIDRERFRFDFMTFNGERDGCYEEILELGGKVFFLPSRREGAMEYHRELDAFFSEHASEYDAVHFHAGSFTTVAPLYYARKYGVGQRIAHIHSAGCSGIHNQLLHRLNRIRIPSLATDFLGCSLSACAWGYSSTSARNRAKVVTNGIDLTRFRFDGEVRSRARSSFGLGNEHLILHVGSFNMIKNHRFLLDAFAILQRRKPDARLMCVGDGELSEEMETYARSLGLGERVMFPGRRDDVEELLMAADLLVLPSLHEGLGIVMIEAQACGLPVLASTGVPVAAKVNSDVRFLPLEKGAGVWAAEMESMLAGSERKVSPDIAGFSNQATLRQMLRIYGG